MFDDLDRKIIAAMQDDLPLVPRPYAAVAERLGVGEDELLARLQRYRAGGELRRMGAVLRHREVGYAANALCAWQVPADRLEEAAATMAASAAVTHCYAREPRPGWPYNFYVMLHGHTREECAQLAEALAAGLDLGEFVMLFSTREWKKTSMRYFGEGER
ncbi:MAG TPA: AsnC family transcriptional regulator [Negativicutes bacterium]|nr:AsnC family transcriptional regulator [Negativicutes bacterium]